MPDFSFRAGRQADAPALAELVNFAGEGMPLQLWEGMREGSETAWDVGRRRAARDEGSFSYRNAVVAEADGQIAAALIGYAQPAVPEPIDYATMPAPFVPLQELENLAPNSWYVNVLATYPAYRRQGLGRALLGIADEIAAKQGLPGLSVIVSNANSGATRLYVASGYREIARRPKVKGKFEVEGDSWILLTKTL